MGKRNRGRWDILRWLMLKAKKISNIIPYWGSRLYLSKTANITGGGRLFLHDNSFGSNGRSTILRMDDSSNLELQGDFSVYYGGDIICFAGSHLKLGSGFFNSNVKIRCTSDIEIGSDVAISHDVTIMDSDAHELDGSEKTKRIIIGNHVWIGSRAMILKGVTIGDGAVIGAGAIVTRNIPAHSLAVGSPAQIIRENIEWRS